MDAEKLVRMANQIGQFFRHEGAVAAPESIRKHLVDFWDPRMKTAIIAHLEAGGAGLEPFVREAIVRLAASARSPAA
jgi:formate dehydrogenase subunit delta